MLTHVVMFSFVDGTDVAEVVRRLRALEGQIPSLKSLRCGTNARTGEHALDIVLMTEHDSMEGLLAYIDDPTHQEFAEWLKPQLTRRAVVDTIDLA